MNQVKRKLALAGFSVRSFSANDMDFEAFEHQRKVKLQEFRSRVSALEEKKGRKLKDEEREVIYNKVYKKKPKEHKYNPRLVIR